MNRFTTKDELRFRALEDYIKSLGPDHKKSFDQYLEKFIENWKNATSKATL